MSSWAHEVTKIQFSSLCDTAIAEGFQMNKTGVALDAPPTKIRRLVQHILGHRRVFRSTLKRPRVRTCTTSWLDHGVRTGGEDSDGVPETECGVLVACPVHSISKMGVRWVEEVVLLPPRAFCAWVQEAGGKITMYPGRVHRPPVFVNNRSISCFVSFFTPPLSCPAEFTTITCHRYVVETCTYSSMFAVLP